MSDIVEQLMAEIEQLKQRVEHLENVIETKEKPTDANAIVQSWSGNKNHKYVYCPEVCFGSK